MCLSLQDRLLVSLTLELRPYMYASADSQFFVVGHKLNMYLMDGIAGDKSRIVKECIEYALVRIYLYNLAII